MRPRSYLAGLALVWSICHAADVPRTAVAPAGAANAPRAAEIHAVTSTGAGQAGYVHYFLLTHPDGSEEHQVGVELEDQRIAWSFPNAGVMVSAFIKTGELDANGKVFKIAHLHGVRPFADAGAMRVLQKDLTPRVVQWIDDNVPYCVFRQPGADFCLNCGDFVTRLLFPGSNPLLPALPDDYIRARQGHASGDDLLLYMLGLHRVQGRQPLLDKVSALNLPDTLRADLLQMIAAATIPAVAVATAQPAIPVAQKPASAAPVGRIALRRPPARKL